MPQGWSARCGEISLRLPGMEIRLICRLILSLVPMLTELSLLQHQHVNVIAIFARNIIN
jgi:hypothetical protein